MTNIASTPIQDQINAYWNWRGASYDSQPGHGKHLGEAEQAAWVATIQALLPPPPAMVLDVGTGTGFLAFIAAELGHRVTGVDLAEGMLAQAHEQSRPMINPPTFLIGDAIAPDFPPATFDVVMNRHLLWTLRDPEQAFRNWWQLLKPGGRVVAIDSFWFDPNRPLTIDEEEVRQQWERFYSAEVQSALPNFALDNVAPLMETLTRPGFIEVTIEILTHIRDAEAVPIGHAPRYALLARRPLFDNKSYS